jgi:hypothetical protein
VQGNSLATTLWKKLGFEPVVVTAATHRGQAEIALGTAAVRIIPVAYESTSAGKNALHASVSTSRSLVPTTVPHSQTANR